MDELSQLELALQERLKTYKPPFGPIGKQVYTRTYSRDKEDGTKETWADTAIRSVDGNLALVDKQFIEWDERYKLINLMLDFGVIPAGRHLYASGVKGRQFLFNCHSSGWDPLLPGDHFTFLFDALMQGGGVGANYSNRYMELMPPVMGPIDLHIVCRKDHPNIDEFKSQLCNVDTTCESLTHEQVFVVPDSREGWVEAIQKILDLAFSSPMDGIDHKLIIDVSEIRAKGLPLRTSGGIACGPGPLVSMLSDFTKHLNGCRGRRLSSLDAMVLDHILAACVVAGGKRRSSRMSVKNWKDADIFEFINCKLIDGTHWTTNISVEVDDEFTQAYAKGDSHAKAVMRAVVLGKRTNGEPGLWNRTLAQKGERNPEEMYCPNPCGEIGLAMWENCNLGHVNLEYFATRPLREAKEAFRLMTRWLMRATFGDIPSPRQREVVNRNRRIGVGFFGFHSWLALNGIKYSECWNNEWVRTRLSIFQQVVNEEAERYAKILGIPVPAKTTTLAPTGTTAALVGAPGSGQAMMFPWYKRRVRYFDMDPELLLKREEGYPVYPDTDARNTWIVEYWCEDPLVAKVRAAGWDPEQLLEGQDEISFVDALEVQAMLQDCYANNAISYTINLQPDKMPSEEEMENDLIRLLPRLKGTTIYPDKSRKNSPFEKLTKKEFDEYQGQKEISQVEDECKTGCPVR